MLRWKNGSVPDKKGHIVEPNAAAKVTSERPSSPSDLTHNCY